MTDIKWAIDDKSVVTIAIVPDEDDAYVRFVGWSGAPDKQRIIKNNAVSMSIAVRAPQAKRFVVGIVSKKNTKNAVYQFEFFEVDGIEGGVQKLHHQELHCVADEDISFASAYIYTQGERWFVRESEPEEYESLWSGYVEWYFMRYLSGQISFDQMSTARSICDSLSDQYQMVLNAHLDASKFEKMFIQICDALGR